MKTREWSIFFPSSKIIIYGHILKKTFTFSAWSFLLIHIQFTPIEGPKNFVNWYFKNSNWTMKENQLPWSDFMVYGVNWHLVGVMNQDSTPIRSLYSYFITHLWFGLLIDPLGGEWGVLIEENFGNACGSEALKPKRLSERLSLLRRPLCSCCSRRTTASPLLSATASHHGVRFPFPLHPPIFLCANFTTLQYVYKFCTTSPHRLIHFWRLRVWYRWSLWTAILQLPLPQWNAKRKA
jgi:hypothetical protein